MHLTAQKGVAVTGEPGARFDQARSGVVDHELDVKWAASQPARLHHLLHVARELREAGIAVRQEQRLEINVVPAVCGLPEVLEYRDDSDFALTIDLSVDKILQPI